MAQNIVMTSTCDHPGCGTSPAHPVYLLVAGPVKGRRPPIITIDLCAKHGEALKSLYSELRKYDRTERGDK